MKTHKYLDEILEICKNKHLKAEEVFFEIKKKFPKVGSATIYRNLELLVKEGKLRKIVNIDKIAYYETIVSPHIHFIDEETGEIIDFPLDKISIPKNLFERISDIKIIGKLKERGELRI